MDRQCENCHRTNEENALKVQKLERELATCQEYLRNYSERSEAQIKKSDATIMELQKQNKILTDENAELKETLEAVFDEKPKKQSKNQKTAQSNTNFERKEANYIKMIKELEKKNQELLKAPARGNDADIVSILIQRVQELEARNSPRSSTSSAPSIPDSTLEDYRFELAETKFAMEAYDPVGVATEVINGVIAKTNDPLLIVEAQTKLEEFKEEFDEYMKQLDTAIKELSSSDPSTFHVDSLPIFPNPIHLGIFSKFETALKTHKPLNHWKCLICEQNLPGEGVSCVGCKTLYHPECGRIFAEQGLPCFTPTCSKSFTDTKWI